MKVTRIEEVMGRKRSPTLSKLSLRSAIKIMLLKHVVLIVRIINTIINMGDIRQEKPNEDPILK